jgi:hypothetical protein
VKWATHSAGKWAGPAVQQQGQDQDPAPAPAPIPVPEVQPSEPSQPVPERVQEPVRTAPPPVRRDPAPAPAPVQTSVAAQPDAQASAPVQPPPQPQPQPQPQSQPAGPSREELNAVRESYNNLSIRTATVKTGLQNLQSQMGGLSLRADMREASTRLDYLMQEAMSSLKAGDIENAKRNLDLADRTAERIEKFLTGR